MKLFIARFFDRRQHPVGKMKRFRSTALVAMSALVLLSACIDKNYRPPIDPPPPSHRTEGAYSEEPFSGSQARYDAIGNNEIAPPANIDTDHSQIKVAMLLPLTGRNAKLARAMEQAATLALFDQYASLSPKRLGTKVKLLPIDVGDTQEDARAAAIRAVQEKVNLIIGPIFSDAVEAVTPIVQRANIPLISFSNNKSVAKPGVYIFGFSPEQQASRIVSYAFEGGRTNLAALIPDSPYGRTVLQAVQEAAQQNDVEPLPSASYSPQGVGIETAINRLMPEGRPPFDALFLPESGPALAAVLRTLDGKTGSRIGLLGTGLWDDQNLVRQVNLQGALLATSPPSLTSAFEKRFHDTYHYTPTRIASLAYDAVALSVTLATSGRGFDNKVLTHPAGFKGPANGLFRFLPNGLSERKLAVALIQSSRFIVVDPAPISFAK